MDFTGCSWPLDIEHFAASPATNRIRIIVQCSTFKTFMHLCATQLRMCNIGRGRGGEGEVGLMQT